MAIVDLAIVHDNIVSGCNLLAVHSPLKFIAEIQDNDSPYLFPDYLDVEITNITTSTVYTGYKAYQYLINGDKSRYIFNAEKILRSLMASFDDLDGDTIDYPRYLVERFSIKFKYISLNDSVEIFAYCSSKQNGEQEVMQNIFDNDDETIISFAGREFYMHFYGALISDTIVFDGTTVDPSYSIRKRKTISSIGTSTAFITVGGVTSKTITINTLPDCPNGLYIKFLDSDTGYYKHWLFSKFYLIEGEHSNIGQVENFSLNLLQGSERSIGRKVKRKIIVSADLTQTELEYIDGLFSSPRICYQSGTTWLSVELDNGNNAFRYRKNNSGQHTFTFVEPERNTITML